MASHLFEVAANDVEFSEGSFAVAGTDIKLPILELAERVRVTADLPDELKSGLDTIGEFVSPQMSFPNGCHYAKSKSIRKQELFPWSAM